MTLSRSKCQRPTTSMGFLNFHSDEMDKDGEGQLPDVDEEALLADPNEAECDLEWHRRRLEREKFLQEQRVRNHIS